MKILERLIFILVFVSVLALIIIYSRGYRLNLEKKSLVSTGILSITSFPSTAKVYLNGRLKGVTDINLSLTPGEYFVEIKKDGFNSWKKTLKIKGELVYNINAFLVPLNPSLLPLTNLGVFKAIPLGENDKIIIFVKNDDETKEGVYLFDAGKKPAILFPPVKLLLSKTLLPEKDLVDWKKTNVLFSPDLKQAIFEFYTNDNSPFGSYLLSLEEENKTLFDITSSKEVLLSAWEKEKEKEMIKILETFPKEFVKVASDSFRLISYSPKKTKVLYQAKEDKELPLIIKPPLPSVNQTTEERVLKKDNFYIYDKKEDKNYRLDALLKEIILDADTVKWYFDSQRLIFLDEKKIILIDDSGENKQTVYSGPFNDKFFTVTSDGNLIILTNLNPEANEYPDLYLVGIK
ncbi:MAG: PEGA domain-containing protein [Patescibacteria group bacterium]|nr:PEGA domain-containing protein [Patescibacteria group bacterium]